MNQTRRKFLKFSLIGAAGLVLVKIFGSKLFSFASGSSNSRHTKELAKDKEISGGSFKVVKNGDQITFVNSRGEKVLILE